MNFDFIFILTYSRSGSTLLQGILNEIPGAHIRGENQAALRGIYQSWLAAGDARARVKIDVSTPRHAWYGAERIDQDLLGRSLVEAFIRSVLAPTPHATLIGFKEIRYYERMCPDIAAEMDFMRRFFPRAGFIVNTRNLDDTIESAARHGHGVTADEIRASDRRLRNVAAAGRSDIFHVHYDDYVADPRRLLPLYDFLGAPFDLASIRRTLSVRHSF